MARVLPGMQAAFVDVGLERNAFLFVGEVVDPRATYDDLVRDRHPEIAELLSPGQELVVQVLKDPLRDKGARVTTEVTLPGRYLVLLPNGAPQVGVSRRIEDDDERERLRTVAEPLRPEGCGLIVRTAGEGCDEAALAADVAYLVGRWRRISARAGAAATPSRVHADLDLVARVVRDLLDDSVQVIRVGDVATHRQIRSVVEEMEPALAERVKLDDYERPLFDRFGIDRAIDAALEPRVWLPSGGSIVINQTEALVAIDVNTSRFVGRTSLEDTVLATNLEAVEEIALQLRLRNLGGIIVLDLIDMEREESRTRVVGALEAALARDRARTKLLGMSELGLVQLTRKRSRSSLERQLTDRCPYCRGGGRVRSPATVCMDLHRALLEHSGQLAPDTVTVRVHPDVAAHLAEASSLVDGLERALDRTLCVESSEALHRARFEILGIEPHDP